MKNSIEDYLTEKEKTVMKKLEEDYKKTGDKKSYQIAQGLLSMAEARANNKCKKELDYDYI